MYHNNQVPNEVDAYINSGIQWAERKKRADRIKKWAVISPILIVCLFISAIGITIGISYFAGSNNRTMAISDETAHKETVDSNDDASKNYNRVGSKGTFFCSYEYGFNGFDDAITKSYDILDFTILEWLKEDSKEIPKTFFKARINHSYKNTVKQGEEIIIRQNGNGLETLRGFPLFKEGDRILAFVNYLEEDSYYWLINDDLYIFDYTEYENESYWLKRGKITFGDMREYEAEAVIAESVIIQGKNNDPILTEALEYTAEEVYTQVFESKQFSSVIQKRVDLQGSN